MSHVSKKKKKEKKAIGEDCNDKPPHEIHFPRKKSRALCKGTSGKQGDVKSKAPNSKKYLPEGEEL